MMAIIRQLFTTTPIILAGGF
ncbi:hypothetical protein YPPY103_4388, partial [Yersinia pestis PY-103]